jgi:hypothetical protein
MHRKLLGEFEYRGLVGRSHHPKLDVTRLRSDVKWIAAYVAGAHIDLSPNQESSFGHSRLMALAPATRLTWPPFRITSSLSVEPIF